jgi:GTP cyclohydrolase I
MRAAIRSFLEACGLDVAGTHLEETPDRVARVWLSSFLDGYDANPQAIFSEAYPLRPGESAGTVLLKGIPFHGLCPHHLLPYHGLAHIGYLPGKKLASLSSLARLVDCYAHRLEIQETVTRQIAAGLTRHLGALGAAVCLETDQLCMTMRSPERKGTRTITQRFTGAFTKRSELRCEFLQSLESFS